MSTGYQESTMKRKFAAKRFVRSLFLVSSVASVVPAVCQADCIRELADAGRCWQFTGPAKTFCLQTAEENRARCDVGEKGDLDYQEDASPARKSTPGQRAKSESGRSPQAASIVSAGGNCRFRTYGDVWNHFMGPMENYADSGNVQGGIDYATSITEEYQQQYEACGLHDLPGAAESAIGNAACKGNKSGHPVCRQAVNSYPPLSPKQRQAKKCAQLRAQIDSDREYMRLLKEQSRAATDYGQAGGAALESNISMFNKMCK